MPAANDLRRGMAIKYNGNPAIVLEVHHRTPGNLRAFVQAIIRYINTGKSADVRFGSADKVGAKRDIVVIVNESLASECGEARQMVWLADITAETKPFNVSGWTVPEASGNFCSRGGRFGSHSSNENQPPMYAKKYVFVAWFNAGVRAIDISDPYHPREAGYYIPATTDKTDKRCVKTDSGERCKVAIQTNNLEVDDRGYIYPVDRANTGMHILEFKR